MASVITYRVLRHADVNFMYCVMFRNLRNHPILVLITFVCYTRTVWLV